jgi:hypothetical protein
MKSHYLSLEAFIPCMKEEHPEKDIVVGKDNLIQNFWIEIAKAEKHWHIRPAKGCGIIPTAGVQRALDLVWDAAGS